LFIATGAMEQKKHNERQDACADIFFEDKTTENKHGGPNFGYCQHVNGNKWSTNEQGLKKTPVFYFWLFFLN